MEGNAGGVRVFLFYKGPETFKKTLVKKGFIEKRGFKELVLPFNKKNREKRLGDDLPTFGAEHKNSS